MLDAAGRESAGIVVLHRDADVQRAVQRYLRATLRPVFLTPTPADARAAIAREHPELLIVEHAAIVDDPALLADAAAAGVRRCLLAVGAAVDDTPALPAAPAGIDGFALSSLGALGPPRRVDELAVTALKLLRRDLFGMEKYLSWGFVPVCHRLTRAGDRRAVLDGIAAFVAERGLGPRLRWLATQTADELITNALFHGPVDAGGGHPRAALPRADDFALGPDEEVTVRYGCDDRTFAIEVVDGWGSLDLTTLARCLRRSLGGGPLPRPARTGGAGLGLALTAGYVHHLVCNLEPARRTELIALFDVAAPAVRLELTPSFHAFVSRGAA